jgi:NADH-quinone oxidoreductase subunit M
VPPLLSLTLFAPALGAVALGVAAASGERTVRAVAVAAATAALIVALPLWFLYIPRGPEWQFVERIDLLPAIGASYTLGIDGVSLTMVLLTTVGSLIAVGSISSRGASIAVLVLESALLGAFMSLDLLFQLLCSGVAVAATISLLADSGSPRRIVVGTAIAALVSGALMLAGLLILEAQYQSLSAVHSFDMRPYHQLTIPAPVQTRVFVLFLPGLALAPLMFFVLARTATDGRTWLMLPGLLSLNLGVYGLLRVILPILPDASRKFVPLILGVSILVACGGAVASVLRRDRRYSIASVSIAYAVLPALGALSLTPAGLTGSLVQHVALTLSLGAIVLVEGRFRPAGGPDGRAPGMSMPVLVLFLAGMFSLAGAPLFAGFVGLRRTVQGVWPVSRVAAVVAIVLALTSAVSLWRLYRQRTGHIHGGADVRPLPTPGLLETTLPAALVLLSLWIGVHPAPLLSRLETSVARVVMRVSPQYASEVADCLTQPAAPPPANPALPGLPAGMVMAAPCVDDSTSAPGQSRD